MSKKKKVALISLIVLLIGIGIFSHVANQIEGRSSLSKLVEIVLWAVRDDESDIKKLQANLEASAAVSAKPYELPGSMLLNTQFKLGAYEGMQVVYANIETDDFISFTAHQPINKAEDRPIIIYLHGGSYISQPTIAHWAFLDTIAIGTNAIIIAPIYPKAPTHQFSESYERLIPLYLDLVAAYGAEQIHIMGDSAGGGLALGLAQMLLNDGLPQAANVISISPWLDLALEHPDIPNYQDLDPMLSQFKLQIYGRAWAGETSLRDYRVSPLYGPLEGMAPLTIFVGTHEIFLPDTRDFRDLALEAGVELNYFEYPLMNHIFPLYPIPEAKLAQEQIIAVINGEDLPSEH